MTIYSPSPYNPTVCYNHTTLPLSDAFKHWKDTTHPGSTLSSWQLSASGEFAYFGELAGGVLNIELVLDTVEG